MKRSLDLCDVFHQPVGRKMLPIQTVVSAVHRNAVVPNGGGDVDIVIQILVLFVFVQFKFVRLYNGSHFVASFFGVAFL